MNDGKIIIDKIMEKADAEVEKILQEAKREVDLMFKDAEERVMKEKMTYAKQADMEAEKAKAKEISAAELQGRMQLLATKQSLVEDVIAQAKGRLLALSDAQYSEIIAGMLAQLDAGLGKSLIVSKKDQTRLESVAKAAGYVLLEESRELGGGFIVKSGDVEYNYSFASILSVEMEEMRYIAASILF